MRHLFFCTLLVLPSFIFSQASNQIQVLELRTDTMLFSWPTNNLLVGQCAKLPFYYEEENEVCEIIFYTKQPEVKVEIIPSNDYSLIDSLLFLGDRYRFKVQFHDLTKTEFLKFSFSLGLNGKETIEDINLQPFTETGAKIYPKNDELFIGEEKWFEIVTNNVANIVFSNDWITGKDYDYRVSEKGGNLLLHLVPNILGKLTVDIPVSLRKPYFEDKKYVPTGSVHLRYVFSVKTSRLHFLNIDMKDVTLDENSRKNGIEVQLSESRLLNMNKTYRIEGQEEPGGALLAEVFTKQRLANDKVLCLLRPFNYHKKEDGYLYIKNGDEPMFITNFSITPATKIDDIGILREGGEWRSSNIVYPGETIEVKLLGEGLHKAVFYFEDLMDITRDTLIRSENQCVYKLQVPVDINRKTVNIYNRTRPTGKNLKVAEFQKPRDFDFLYLSYGDIGRKVSTIREPIKYGRTINDVVISLNNTAIDKDELYGIQYIEIDLRVTGKKNELIAQRTIENIAVCPDNQSPRFPYYSKKSCTNSDISLNKYLPKKTYDLDEWSKINLTISHKKENYGGEGYSKEVEIILKRNYSFDVEVSFPAGLVTITKKDTARLFGSLSGISMAMIAQFSFYHPDKIATYRPFKIGAGFLALNAFNFSDKVDDRDVGLVILASLYPTSRDTKLSFPLYIGGGYFLKADKFFFLVGPGIRVRL